MLNNASSVLVGLVMIDTKFGRRITVRFFATAIGRGWNHLMSELPSEPDLIGGENKNKMHKFQEIISILICLINASGTLFSIFRV
jgi:hypothetical protein